MYIVYQPEDGDRQAFTFDAGRVRASAAEVMEKRFGDSWETLCAGIQSGNMRARRVLLWHLLTRQHATLRYEDVPDFFADELLVQLDSRELSALRGKVETSKALDDAKRDTMLAAIDDELTLALAREVEAGDVGKAS